MADTKCLEVTPEQAFIWFNAVKKELLEEFKRLNQSLEVSETDGVEKLKIKDLDRSTRKYYKLMVLFR